MAGGADGVRSSVAMRCASGRAAVNAGLAGTLLRHVEGGMQPAHRCSAAVPSCFPIGIGIGTDIVIARAVSRAAGMSSWQPWLAIAGIASATANKARISRFNMVVG